MLGMYSWEVAQVQLNLLGSHDTPRILSILGNDAARLKLAMLFQMTFVGAPCIYYGDEVGMISVPVRGHEGRATMSWDEKRWNVDLRDTVKRYIALRKDHPALRRGAFIPLYADDPTNVYAFVRRMASESLVVVLNNGEQAYEVCVPVKGELADGVEFKDLLGSGRYVVRDGAVTGTSISSRSGVVLQAL
jgi:alpha-glucosidase